MIGKTLESNYSNLKVTVNMMKNRFSEKNLIVLNGQKRSYIYDAPSNKIFATTLDEGLIIQQSQAKGLSEKDVENSLSSIVASEDEYTPSHRDFLVDHKLLKLTMLVATDCNLRCKYCYANHGDYYGYSKSVMKPETAISYIEHLQEYFSEIGRIQFFGGEPLLGIDAIEAVCNYFREKEIKKEISHRPKYTMITNLTLLSQKAIDVIRENDISLTVSIDGPEPVNDFSRIDAKGNGTYKTIVRNIDVCREQIKAFEATYTKYHAKSGMTMEDVKNYIARTFKIDKALIYVCAAIGDNPEVCFSSDEARSITLGMEEAETNETAAALLLKKENQSNLLCNAGYVMLAVMPNGDLYPCHMYALDKSFRMGTFGENGYSDLRDSVYRVRNLLKEADKFSHTECKECWARNFCHRCPAELLIMNPNRRINFECEERKEHYKRNLINCLDKRIK